MVTKVIWNKADTLYFGLFNARQNPNKRLY